MKLFCVVFILVSVCECVIYPSLPATLEMCYRGGGAGLAAPRRLDVFLHAIKKLERNSQLNMRLFSSALLRSLRLDGIEEAPNAKETEFVTPYRASAFQFFRYKLFMDLFLPSQDLLEVDLALDSEEKCTLHRMISSAVQAWERGDESTVCPLTLEQRVGYVTNLNATRARSRCPIEDGIVQTEWGNIAPGTLVAGIAASLESQRVLVSDLLNADVFKTGVSEPLMKGEQNTWSVNIETLNEVMTTASVIESDISNVWVATLAGDLAEVVVAQGPRVGAASQRLIVGNEGRWNDTLLPRSFYTFMRNESVVDWQFTDAEILAGVDGLILAHYLPDWVAQRNTLKLSQVIDMYYSEGGVSFEPTVKACNRMNLYSKIFNRNTLLSEMSSFAHVLALEQGSVYVDVSERDRISEAAVTAYVTSVSNVLQKYHKDCSQAHQVPEMDLIVATDGAWKGYDVVQFISWLSGATELGVGPGRLGVLHGGTGRWLVPPELTLMQLYTDISNYTDWPNRLNFPNVLSTMIEYSINKSLTDAENQASVVPSTVVLVVSPSDRLSATEVERSRELVASLRTSYFDVYFAYVAQDLTGYKNVNNDYIDYSEVFVQTDSTSVTDVIKAINADVIKTVIPKSIIGAHCGFNDTTYTQVEYEDGVLPGRENTYRIHPYYLMQQPLVNVQFRNTGQGSLLACMWRGGEGSRACQTLTERQTYVFNLTNPCLSPDFCTPAHFSVSATSSLNSCAHNDCRMPNQVNYYIRHTGLRCLQLRNASATLYFNVTYVLSFLLVIRIIL